MESFQPFLKYTNMLLQIDEYKPSLVPSGSLLLEEMFFPLQFVK